MKNFIKFVIGKKLSRSLIFQKNKKYIPFKLRSLINPESLYSDFFILDTNIYKNIFIAENIFSLLNQKKIEVEHKFRFYSKEGIFLSSKSYKSNNYLSKFQLPEFSNQGSYISFTHESIPIVKEYNNKFSIPELKQTTIQHRGYSVFFKNKDSLGSIVHGNFGAVSPSNIRNSGAIFRANTYAYTPSYIFKNKNIYHLVFNNPTQKNLKIEVMGINLLDNKRNLFKLDLNPMGTNFVRIKDFEGKISFYSKLPICRSIIFKNPEYLINNENYDVFHS